MPIIYESKADPRHRSGNGKEEKVFDAFEKKYQEVSVSGLDMRREGVAISPVLLQP